MNVCRLGGLRRDRVERAALAEDRPLTPTPRTEMLLALLRARDRTREELAAVGFTAEDLRRARGQLAGQGVDVHLGAASITIGPVPSTLRRRRRRPDRQPELFSAMTT